MPLVIDCFYGPFVQHYSVITTLIQMDAAVDNLPSIHAEKTLIIIDNNPHGKQGVTLYNNVKKSTESHSTSGSPSVNMIYTLVSQKISSTGVIEDQRDVLYDFV